MNKKYYYKIGEFRGKYSPLSNFYDRNIVVYYDGICYKSSEAAYQSAKVLCKKNRKIFTSLSPVDAMKRGKAVDIRPDWSSVKDDIMYQIVKDKFTRNPHMRDFLISTYPMKIEEGNDWGDTYWGICNGKGENKLGKILMRVRKELIINNNLGGY